MDTSDLIALLRDRLRSASSGGFADHAGTGDADLAADSNAAERPSAGFAAAEPPASDGGAGSAGPDIHRHPATDTGDRPTVMPAIDGRRPFDQVLRDIADAERRSLPGGFLAVVGIDPEPAADAASPAPAAGSDRGRRLLRYLRQRRPDLTLWALGRAGASRLGLLVVGTIDRENRTLDQILAALADLGESGLPLVEGEDEPAFITVEALLAALPGRQDVPQFASNVAHTDPASATVAEPDWRRAEQRCIRAYYEGRHAEGVLACDAVLSSPNVPPAVRNQTLRNATFYAPTFASLAPTFDHRRIDLALPPGWFPTNPSIAADGDGYLAIVRTLDYEIVGPHRYRFNGPEGLPHTINYLLRLDRDLRPLAAFPAVDATLLQPRHPCAFAGLEDCRLVRWRDGWVASCGTVDRTASCIGKIDLVRLDPATGAFHSAVPLSDRASVRWEKNWMPVVSGNDLQFVYGCDPLTVLHFDPDLGAVVPHRQHASPPIAREFKGGSQGARVPGGWLFCVHQSADFPDRNRCYLHRFMLLDDEFRMTHLSRPFSFLAPGIEFCAGLALHGDDLVASFGVEDREAHLIRTSLPDVLALLEPVAGAP